MIWLAVIYAIGFLIVGAAMAAYKCFDDSPVGTVVVIVLWPLVLPLLALATAIVLLLAIR